MCREPVSPRRRCPMRARACGATGSAITCRSKAQSQRSAGLAQAWLASRKRPRVPPSAGRMFRPGDQGSRSTDISSRRKRAQGHKFIVHLLSHCPPSCPSGQESVTLPIVTVTPGLPPLLLFPLVPLVPLLEPPELPPLPPPPPLPLLRESIVACRFSITPASSSSIIWDSRAISSASMALFSSPHSIDVAPQLTHASTAVTQSAIAPMKAANLSLMSFTSRATPISTGQAMVVATQDAQAKAASIFFNVLQSLSDSTQAETGEAGDADAETG